MRELVFIEIRKPGRGIENLAQELLFYRASRRLEFQGTCVEKPWACVTGLGRPEASIFIVGVCFLKSQDTHLPVRKNILLLINALHKEEPSSVKRGFYIPGWCLPSWWGQGLTFGVAVLLHSSCPDWVTSAEDRFYPLHSDTSSFYIQRLILFSSSRSMIAMLAFWL